MAYDFTQKHTATFDVPVEGAADTSKSIKLQGISASETDANIICNGIDSLFAIGGLTADYLNGLRTVKENVTIA